MKDGHNDINSVDQVGGFIMVTSLPPAHVMAMGIRGRWAADQHPLAQASQRFLCVRYIGHGGLDGLYELARLFAAYVTEFACIHWVTTS
jgi:hypothetical protein